MNKKHNKETLCVSSILRLMPYNLNLSLYSILNKNQSIIWNKIRLSICRKAYFIAKLFHIAEQYFTRRKAYFIEKSTSIEVLFSGRERDSGSNLLAFSQKTRHPKGCLVILAEREGFEPSEPFPVHTLSRRAP